jgi:hypothetical protein
MNFINNMNFRKSTLLLLLVALTIFVSLSAISAADVNNKRVEFATFSNESVVTYGEPIYAQKLFQNNEIAVDNLEDGSLDANDTPITGYFIQDSNWTCAIRIDGGVEISTPGLHDDYDDLSDIELIKKPSINIDDIPAMRTYDFIPYDNTIYIDGASHNLIIEDAPQNIDLSKCRNVTIISKLSGVTGVISVPEGYMLLIHKNNITFKQMYKIHNNIN